ncbi:MAG TPA: hypothetical protein VMH80_13330 [Bryobacteraceae bacterium]|nr:hypothetical protein [Bryobacteraceae bacterium]
MDAETKKLLALREELRKDLEALERVERLMAAKNGSPAAGGHALPINLRVADSLAIDDGDEDDEGPANSLRGTIESTINANPEVRWTNQKMLAHLQKIQFPLRAKKPIYSIGQAMQKLQEAGKIRIVRRGAGNQPNIYKAKERSSATTETAPTSEQGGKDGMEPRVVQ